jgi:phosphoenolpyruvate carboxylase
MASQEFAHPSQMRAIPNNAVLQQLGLLANTVSGLGRATAKDPEQFRAMLRDSPRFRRAMAMVVFALSLSDLDVLRAYVDTLDPGVWLNRSGRTRIPARRDELRVIARHLERNDIHARLVKVYRRLQADYLLLRDQLAGAEAGAIFAQAVLSDERREDLALLHALRIALIHRIYLLASHIPDFTPQRGFTRDDLLQRLIHLDVDEVVSLLKEIFPLRDASETEGHDFAEPASYRGGAGQTYEVEHERIFNPIAANFTLLRRIGAAITYHIGAVG